MELTKEELKIVIESLIFTASGDVCLNGEEFDSRLAIELAKELNDESIEQLACYLYKGSDEYYEPEFSRQIESSIPQIKVVK